MALIKSRIIRGIDCSYWKIVDCNVKTGQVMISPYVNKESAKARDNMMDGRTAIQIDFPVDVSCPLAYAYSKIKESKMSEAIGVEGEEGYVAPVETNWFADATDEI